MGNCFENISLQSSHGDEQDDAARERIRKLQVGNKFTKKAMLGLSQQELFIRLSDDTSALLWKTENTWTAASHGQVDLVNQVKKLKMAPGENGLQIIGLDDTVSMEIKAEDTATRDEWMVVVNELLSQWKERPETKPKTSVSAAGSSNKAEYFKSREAEMQAREKVNAERKAKLIGATGGMKHTAQIMANRA